MKTTCVLLISTLVSTCLTNQLEAGTSWWSLLLHGRAARGGTAFTLGVDEEALREDVMALHMTDCRNEVIETQIKEILNGDIDERIVEVLRRRLDGLDFDDAIIQGMGYHRFLVKVPGSIEVVVRRDVRCALQSCAYLEFRLAHPRNNELCQELFNRLITTHQAPEGYALNNVRDGFVRLPNYYEFVRQPGYKARLSAFGKPPQGYQFMLEKDRDGSYRPIFVKRKAELTGQDLVSAHVERDNIGRIVIAFKLNAKGGSTMRKISGRNIGRQLVILLDGQVISAPVLQSEVGTSGLITGNFSMNEAKHLVSDLNAGALPVPLKVLAEENFAPESR